jgi:hypothetical protein
MPQLTNTVLMVRPARFAFNEQTAESNAFQQNTPGRSPESIRAAAREEFDAFVEKLRGVGVNVLVAEDTPEPPKPDAVFPNNWVSFHEDGTVVLYPMNTPNRRIERRAEIVELAKEGRRFSRLLDLSPEENHGRFLEGTGSMVLDHVEKVAYACVGPRTDESLLDRFCAELGYQKAAFHAVDGEGRDIYHTNVVMALGEDFVVICLDTVQNLRERALLLGFFEETGKAVVEISLDQMNRFAGNMLQVKSIYGARYLVMSQQAHDALTPEQVETLEGFTNLLPVPLFTIETYGGGSARCMLAEVFLPEEKA